MIEVLNLNLENQMSTVDVNTVIVTGENSVIRLNKNDSDAFTTQASFWRILTSPAGPGDVLYLKSELTEDRWRIYSDNIAMARWLQSTVVGAINAELRNPAIPVVDAQFSKSGNARDFSTERLDAHNEHMGTAHSSRQLRRTAEMGGKPPFTPDFCAS
jgi:hypothetical protein